MNHNRKIKSDIELSKICADLKKGGKTIVFTNGCFDLLHPGHLHYLLQARQLGDFLIIGINSDASVRKIKGERRPLSPQPDRLEMIAGLECVDYATTFEEPDPYRLISLLKPDVLVKGGDWEVDQIIGKELVEKEGGKVVSIPFTPGYSTTRLIEKIVARYGKENQ
ncbi:MAG: D-glycero-beta-D-manno-heptose 1-phosphate adenylyltransferase [Nitrospiria bacterium]